MSRKSRKNEERAAKLAFITSLLLLVSSIIEMIIKLIE